MSGVVGKGFRWASAAAGLGIVGAIASLGAVIGAVSVLAPASQPPLAPAAVLALDHKAVTVCPGLSWKLLVAQQSVESSFSPTALSPSGAEGLSQFLPSTFVSYDNPVPPGGANPPSPWDPTDAAYAQARYLCSLGITSDPFSALVSYNCGNPSPTCVLASSGYADKIISLAEAFPSSGLAQGKIS